MLKIQLHNVEKNQGPEQTATSHTMARPPYNHAHIFEISHNKTCGIAAVTFSCVLAIRLGSTLIHQPPPILSSSDVPGLAAQVVIIAAGFDTRAYRMGRPDVRFYELDVPSASRMKQQLAQDLMPEASDSRASADALDCVACLFATICTSLVVEAVM